MVREIVKDVKFLQQRSDVFEFAGIKDKTIDMPADEYLIQDMLDTANYHIDHCLGLAAVQIGVLKRIIVVKIGKNFRPFINPVIINRSKETYLAKEGCLSLEGQREVRRHRTVKVAYTTRNKQVKVETFSGITAEIIQHEVDHLNGILI